MASPDESVVAESAATAPGPLLGTSTTVAPSTGPDPLLTVASNESAPAWRVGTVVGEPSVAVTPETETTPTADDAATMSTCPSVVASNW